jgi:hypothetical protein
MRDALRIETLEAEVEDDDEDDDDDVDDGEKGV